MSGGSHTTQRVHITPRLKRVPPATARTTSCVWSLSHIAENMVSFSRYTAVSTSACDLTETRVVRRSNAALRSRMLLAMRSACSCSDSSNRTAWAQ